MNAPLTVLLVEDSESDAGLVIRQLEQAGYEVAHERVETAPQMQAALAARSWDIVLSDYSMPGFSAGAALELLQQTGIDIPFIIVSGAIGEDVAVSLMKAGAHDYVMKGNLARLSSVVYWEIEEAKDRLRQCLANQALQVREARYRAVAESANDAIITIDAAGNILEWNAAAGRMYGYGRDEAVGQHITLIIPDRLRESHLHGLEQRRQDDSAGVDGKLREVAGKRRDGSEFPMELSLSVYDIGAEKYYTAIIRDISERREAEGRIQELLMQLRMLTKRMFDNQEHERKRFASELHDELGQWLVAIQAEAEAICSRTTRKSARDIHVSASAISQSISSVYEIIHNMVRRLRPILLSELGLGESLREMITQWCARHPQIQCTLNVDDGLDLDALGEPFDIILYRIVQESLTNVARHAKASRVSMQISHVRGSTDGADELLLTLSDNGIGMDVDSLHEGMGLLGLRERVAAAAGKLVLFSMPGQGVRIDIRLPLDNQSRKTETDHG